MEIHRFKKGETIHIDTIYNFMGLIPSDAYRQDDPSGDRRVDGFDDDCITFTKNVTVKFDVKVT